MNQDTIIVIDLGSTENSDLARYIRSLGVYSEILPHDIDVDKVDKSVKGIILNGGMNRIVDGEMVDVDPKLYDLEIPVLSIDHPTSKADLIFKEKPTDDEIKSFVFDKCQADPTWNVENFIESEVKRIQDEVKDKKVLLALSGGVDSSVVAALLIKAIGKQLVCVHVNNGLMRKDESESVLKVFKPMLEENLIYVDAEDRFLSKLEGVSDPEKKRKIIGNEFVYIFDEESNKLEGIDYLAQGTIYSDVVESGTKTSKGVKSHHNVGGLPEDMTFKLIEPMASLFKDEVRACGLALGLSEDMVFRQPFPGPGLGVRVLGAITKDRLEAVRESDAILREEFKNYGLNKKVWQYFTVVPDFKSVGVRDGHRTYAYPVIIRAVNAVDGMTATIEEIDYEVLHKVTDRILNEVPHVNRVLYDLSPKPVATIEW
ncbi:MAG: glutamine-hydrolyzing GMP synthase, partial [Erysipelothrix sp.]|nr:glutamine-hydrolyzing GMP synthase [Erysipelothrix sp.]